MKRTAQQVADIVGGKLSGRAEVILESVASLKNAGPQDLSYAEAKYHADVASTRAGCVIVADEVPDRTVIVVKNPKLAFAKAAAVLLEGLETGPAIHPTAIIEPTAAIGAGTRVGAGCVIGQDVK